MDSKISKYLTASVILLSIIISSVNAVILNVQMKKKGIDLNFDS